MLNENYNSPSASGLKDVEGNGISHPMNRQDILNPQRGQQVYHCLATIIERAEEIYKSLKDSSNRLSQFDYLLCTGAYIRGATEQRDVDINKICEWMENHLPYYCDEFDESYTAEAIRDFREAMTKEN